MRGWKNLSVKSKSSGVLGLIIGVGILVAMYTFISGPAVDNPRGGKVLRMRAEATSTIHITLMSDSSVHGNRDHVDASYSRDFTYDIVVAPDEVVAVFFTGAADIDQENRQQISIRIMENGKIVASDERVVRAKSAGSPVSASWRTIG